MTDTIKPTGSSPLTRGKRTPHAARVPASRLIPTHAGKTKDGAGDTSDQRAHPHSRGENSHLTAGTPHSRGSSPLTRGKRDLRRVEGEAVRLIPTHAGKTPRSDPDQSPQTAHPHSRGENDARPDLYLAVRGSSPLTRGKRAPHGALPYRVRLIPTHAGKTVRSAAVLVLIRAHPHSRGENSMQPYVDQLREGSSPLTRGKRPVLRPVRGRVGLIPTHAGKTDLFLVSKEDTPAHPHSRGENGQKVHSGSPSGGSSPLTRGKPRHHDKGNLRVGLIPTHAGKTRSSGHLLLVVVAHPHSRGENAAASCAFCSSDGSSPLTRGKPSVQTLASTGFGLIPTHAGKTSSRRSAATSKRVHPHSRGENARALPAGWTGHGSSPLTRGKPVDAWLPGGGAGLIPTHAGKTGLITRSRWLSRAHPHSRGENCDLCGVSVGGGGSSPLTRGKLRITRPGEPSERLIPTHAGKTRSAYS